MKAFSAVPEGYRDILHIDLKQDKKLAVFVNVLSIAIGILMAVPMHAVVPFTTLFAMDDIGMYFARFGVMMASLIAYVVLHEAVHGIAMKLCGTRKVKYGFTGLYAFAGSEDYYDKSGYLFIALAPVVVWGVVLLLLNLLVPTAWFWVIYSIQIVNISGAAGDFYVTVKFSKLPADILVRDAGVSMAVFSAKE